MENPSDLAQPPQALCNESGFESFAPSFQPFVESVTASGPLLGFIQSPGTDVSPSFLIRCKGVKWVFYSPSTPLVADVQQGKREIDCFTAFCIAMGTVYDKEPVWKVMFSHERKVHEHVWDTWPAAASAKPVCLVLVFRA